MVAGAVRSMKPGPKTRMLVDLPDLGIPFSMDLIAVKRDFLQELAAYGGGDTQSLYRRRGSAENQKRVCLQSVSENTCWCANDSLDEAYEYSVKYLDRQAKVDPAVIQTVLNWENKGDRLRSTSFSTIQPSIGLSKRGSSSGCTSSRWRLS